MLDCLGEIYYLTFLGVTRAHPQLNYGRHYGELDCIRIAGGRILSLSQSYLTMGRQGDGDTYIGKRPLTHTIIRQSVPLGHSKHNVFII